MQISRRNALATGAAAVITGAATAPLAMKAAGVKAALAGDPVIGLVEQLKAARQARNVADDAYEEAAYKKGFSICADFNWVRVKPADGHEYSWGPDQIRRAATDGRLTQEQAACYLAEAKDHKKKTDHVRRQLGLGPFKKNTDFWAGRYYQLEAEILDTPALTVAGVLAKLQGWYGDYEIEAMREGENPYDGLDSAWVASIYRDLERLAGSAPS